MVFVRDLMTKRIIAVPRNSSVYNVAVLMWDHQIGSVVVTESKKNPTPIGIITERDFVGKIVVSGEDPKKLKAEDIMTSPIITIEETSGVEAAGKLMNTKNIKKLAVVSGTKLTGILTETDLVKNQHKILGELFDTWVKSQWR
jgi:CBS domain-containing protein